MSPQLAKMCLRPGRTDPKQAAITILWAPLRLPRLYIHPLGCPSLLFDSPSPHKVCREKKNPETETNKTLVVAGEISGGRRCRTRSAPTASGARRSSSTTPPATPSAPSAASSSRLTPSTRPPSGEPSPTSRATTTPSVSAGPPTRCSPTAASPQ